MCKQCPVLWDIFTSLLSLGYLYFPVSSGMFLAFRDIRISCFLALRDIRISCFHAVKISCFSPVPCCQDIMLFSLFLRDSYWKVPCSYWISPVSMGFLHGMYLFLWDFSMECTCFYGISHGMYLFLWDSSCSYGIFHVSTGFPHVSSVLRDSQDSKGTSLSYRLMWPEECPRTV